MKSPIVEKMYERMKCDPWYVKLRRWWKVDVYFFFRIGLKNWFENIFN